MSLTRVRIIERSTVPVLSLETCRRQCELVAIETDSDGVDHHPDDDLLLGFLDAAVDYAEDFTGLAIRFGTYEFALDAFPRRWGDLAIEIPRPPFVGALSFTCSDDSDGELEEGVDYIVDAYGDMARLRPVTAWPGIAVAGPNRVVFRFMAGYSEEGFPDSDRQVLPGAIRSAILLMLNHLYENRSATVEKAMAELPLGVEALMRPKRVLTGMA